MYFCCYNYGSMSVIEDFRKVLQDFLAPELRSVHSEIKATNAIMEAKFGEVESRIFPLHDKMQILTICTIICNSSQSSF